MRALLMRLDAPLLSFGAPIVDNFGVVQEMPTLSMLTGLLGNALGYEHRQGAELNKLQERLRFAACRERAGERLRDFQTVDFSQGTDDLRVARTVGWTTRGRVEQRAGSAATLREKHIRYRDYWAGAVYTIALALDPPELEPTVETLAAALNEPERPLFIGRKPCLPSTPLLLGLTDAPTLLAALEDLDEVVEMGDGECALWWEEGDEPVPNRPSVRLTVTDERDWTTQLHGGQRLIRRSTLSRARKTEGTDGHF